VIRRERRALARVREDKLRDLGGLMLEMYRRDVFREDLLAERCSELLGLDARLHELDEMLAAAKHRIAAGRCECGAPLPWGSHFCPNCGRPAGERPVIACAECGHPLPGDARFCASCGAASASENARSDKEGAGAQQDTHGDGRQSGSASASPGPVSSGAGSASQEAGEGAA
jgi:RNA polymerase subunit RPABC4/transcription elongation factor Spt4